MRSPPIDAPRRPFGPAPLRRADSIRRTTSIDTDWPDGRDEPMRVRAHARDWITGDSAPGNAAEGRVLAKLSLRREILELSTVPAKPEVAALIGVRAGGHLRAALERALPADREAASPVYLLLDDLAGASLVANWAWSNWVEGWAEVVRSGPRKGLAGKNGSMQGICAGFRPGSAALNPDGSSNMLAQSSAAVGPLGSTDDPEGWHAVPEQLGVGMRRARRMDVWVDDVIHIDAGFQDSSTSPQGGRVAVHEYHVVATADREGFTLRSISAEPRILPYGECPAAAANVQRLIGAELSGFRREVIDRLPGTLGCTHLNDVLRSFADVPRLVAALSHRAPVS
jgi:hypothetical protein